MNVVSYDLIELIKGLEKNNREEISEIDFIKISLYNRLYELSRVATCLSDIVSLRDKVKIYDDKEMLKMIAIEITVYELAFL